MGEGVMENGARCTAVFRFEGDGGWVSFRCQLREGHGGRHSQERAPEDGFPFLLIWADDMSGVPMRPIRASARSG